MHDERTPKDVCGEATKGRTTAIKRKQTKVRNKLLKETNMGLVKALFSI